VASALAAAAELAGSSTSGIAAAAALACAFDPDFGAVLRAVLAGALRVALAGDLRVDADAVRFAGALRADAEDRFAGLFPFAGVDLEDEAEVFLAAGFFLPALERVELVFERLLGFFAGAMTTHYS
jgi:hypothetical protein